MSAPELLMRLLFPPRCVACGTLRSPLAAGTHAILCETCAAAYERSLRVSCRTCAQPLYSCNCVPPLLRAARIPEHIKLAPYGTDARSRVPRRLVLYMKDHARAEVLAFAARELAPGIWDALRRRRAEDGARSPETVLTFLPRRRQAAREAGQDQSKRLAEALAAELGLPFRQLLVRTGESREQKTQNARERQRNLKNAFAASDASGLRVLLVDDVVTTGASMAAAARQLYRAGAAEVLAVSFAYTLKIL